MRFYTTTECQEWLSGREFSLAEIAKRPYHRVLYPPRLEASLHLASVTASLLMNPRPDEVLLWVDEWGIWPANLHLYYKLRQTYHDFRHIHEAPGHLFLAYELEDLATLLQVMMINGWGGHLITESDYTHARFSHDEYIDFFSRDEDQLNQIRQAFATKT